LFFIGAPLGAIIRKGGLGMPVVVATLFFIFYYIISITGEKTVKQGLIPAYQGMWLSAAVLMPLGIFLTFRATADSVLFDLDAYKNVIKKLFGIKEKRARKLLKISDSRNIDKDYSDLHIVDNMKELSEMCSFYISNHLKMGFFQTIIHLVSFKNKEGIDKIRKGYNYLIFYMLEKSKNSNYYKNKIQEIPFDINIKSHRSVLHFVKLILLIPAFPLVVIFHIIEMYQLKRKLKQIIVITDDLVNIVDNPELLELKRN
jgi:lipopolysaccharide export system permease protein